MEGLVALAAAMPSVSVQAQTPAQNYTADITCAAMAQAVKIDPSPALKTDSGGLKTATELADVTRSRALISGQIVSMTVAQVDDEITLKAKSEVRLLGKLSGPAQNDEYTRLGRALIGCALGVGSRGAMAG